MKKFLVAILVVSVLTFFVPVRAEAAGIALDSQAKSTSASAAFVNTAGDFMVVCAYAATSISNVTYNSVAMTQIGINSSDVGRQTLSMWILSSPATGSHTLAVTASGFTEWFALTYSGTSLSGQPDGSNTNTGSGTGPATASVTVTANGSWLVGCEADSVGGETAGSNTTFRQTDTGNGIISADSNAAQSPGSHSLNVNYSGSATSWGFKIVSVAPAATAVATPILSLINAFWIW